MCVCWGQHLLSSKPQQLTGDCLFFQPYFSGKFPSPLTMDLFSKLSWLCHGEAAFSFSCGRHGLKVRLAFLSESLFITSQEGQPDRHRLGWLSSLDCLAVTRVIFYRLGLLGLVPLILCVTENGTLLDTQHFGGTEDFYRDSVWYEKGGFR